MFQYEYYIDADVGEFERALRGTLIFHAYDDWDGKGFYTYTKELCPYVSITRPAEIQEALRERIFIMLRARDEDLALIAERYAWEQNIALPDRAYKTRGEVYDLLKQLEARPYVPQEDGAKYYTGVEFSLPLVIYNDGDGRCPYFFSDIMYVSYAKEQIREHLALFSRSINRWSRAMAIEYVRALFDEDAEKPIIAS